MPICVMKIPSPGKQRHKPNTARGRGRRHIPHIPIVGCRAMGFDGNRSPDLLDKDMEDDDDENVSERADENESGADNEGVDADEADKEWVGDIEDVDDEGLVDERVAKGLLAEDDNNYARSKHERAETAVDEIQFEPFGISYTRLEDIAESVVKTWDNAYPWEDFVILNVSDVKTLGTQAAGSAGKRPSYIRLKEMFENTLETLGTNHIQDVVLVHFAQYMAMRSKLKKIERRAISHEERQSHALKKQVEKTKRVAIEYERAGREQAVKFQRQLEEQENRHKLELEAKDNIIERKTMFISDLERRKNMHKCRPDAVAMGDNWY